ncbi:hypothetical protein BDR22DRAFT_876300 [Usnea florida]
MALPNELMLDICGHLANPDLKACRLVSKSWSAPASVYLFSKIYISPRKEDIEVFNLITQHALLSRCVETLEYDGTTFSSDVSKDRYFIELSNQVNAYPKLYRTYLGNKDAEFTQFIESCLKKPFTIPREFMGSNFVLEGCREWKDRDEYQRRIVMNGEFLKILECGLGKLEFLKFVEITDSWPSWKLRDLNLTGDLTHSYFYGSPFGRAWQLSHPEPVRGIDSGSRRIRVEGSYGWVEASDPAFSAAQAPRSIHKQTSNKDTFEVITIALSQSQKHLRSFSMHGVPVSVFDPTVGGIVKNGNISAYSSVEQFVLGFGRTSWSCHSDAPYLAAVQALLGSMRGLKSLELYAPFRLHPRFPPSHKYWDIFPTDGTQWIALTKLKLYGFRTSARKLCHLLKIRMPNLHELRLLNVDLSEGQWEEVIEFLKTSMYLLSFPTEFWRCSHQRGEPFPAGTLAEREAFGKEIGDYIAKGGRHPCLRADEDDSASTRYLSDLNL